VAQTAAVRAETLGVFAFNARKAGALKMVMTA
jgi:hypothetical protein